MKTNREIIAYVILFILGFISAFLNGWVYLLERTTQPLLLTGMGVLMMIAGLINVRRRLKP